MKKKDLEKVTGGARISIETSESTGQNTIGKVIVRGRTGDLDVQDRRRLNNSETHITNINKEDSYTCSIVSLFSDGSC